MDSGKIKRLYDGTIGKFVAAGYRDPLCFVNLGARCGSPVVDLNLSVNLCGLDDEEISEFRHFSKRYLMEGLAKGENGRWLFGVKYNPRIILSVRRHPGLFDLSMENADIRNLVSHWCERAGLGVD